MRNLKDKRRKKELTISRSVCLIASNHGLFFKLEQNGEIVDVWIKPIR